MRVINFDNGKQIEFFPIIGYENYLINESGNLKNLKGKIIKTRVDRAGYLTARLRKNCLTYTVYIHRLLAQTFLEKPFNKEYVNHINGIKLDNRISNLEWVSHSENITHAYQIGLIKKSTSIIRVIDTCNRIEYKSIKEAAISNGIPYSTCKNYLNGNRKNPTCLRIAA